MVSKWSHQFEALERETHCCGILYRFFFLKSFPEGQIKEPRNENLISKIYHDAVQFFTVFFFLSFRPTFKKKKMDSTVKDFIITSITPVSSQIRKVYIVTNCIAVLI